MPVPFDCSHQGHALVTLYVQFLYSDWSKFDRWVHAENLCSILNLVYFDSWSWQSFVSTCNVFNCLFPLNVQNKIQLLSRVFCYSWLVCLLGFWLRNTSLWPGRKSDFGWHRFVFHLAWCVIRLKSLKRFWSYFIIFSASRMVSLSNYCIYCLFFISNLIKSSVVYAAIWFTADSGWAFNDVSYRVRYHGWLVALQGKLSDVARRGWYRFVWEKVRCRIDLYVMAIEIKIQYSYYSTKRITPVYIVEEELIGLEYSKFVERIVNEVRHLRRMNSLRLTVKEDETVDEADLSRKYLACTWTVCYTRLRQP